jgi:hypothetical protein
MTYELSENWPPREVLSRRLQANEAQDKDMAEAMPAINGMTTDEAVFIYGGIRPEMMEKMIAKGFPDNGWLYPLIDAVLSNDARRVTDIYQYRRSKTWPKNGSSYSDDLETLQRMAALGDVYTPALQKVTAQTWRHLDAEYGRKVGRGLFSVSYKSIHLLPRVSPPAATALADMLGSFALVTQAEDYLDSPAGDACRRILDVGYVSKTSSDTVMQTSFLKIDRSYHTLRTIFNFRSGRVKEIYIQPQLPPVTTDAAIEEYDENMVAEMKKSFVDLGGTLPGRSRLDKNPGLMD